MKKTSKNLGLGISLGLLFGIAFGKLLFDNIAIGMAVGMAIGSALGIAKDNKVNEQMENLGYTVKEIRKTPDSNDFEVVIVSKGCEEITVAVDADEMDSEEFAIGDAVFLTEDGRIEAAFEKDDDTEY